MLMAFYLELGVLRDLKGNFPSSIYTVSYDEHETGYEKIPLFSQLLIHPPDLSRIMYLTQCKLVCIIVSMTATLPLFIHFLIFTDMQISNAS